MYPEELFDMEVRHSIKKRRDSHWVLRMNNLILKMDCWFLAMNNCVYPF